MSAIAGVWSPDASPTSPGRGNETADLCSKMLSALRLYGADDCAQWSNPSIAMGRCLLHLLPEDQFDRQPLVSGDGFTLVSDLRLDNRGELARTLKLPDASHRSDCDILLEAWRHWGERTLEHLEGAFSFAIFDQRRQELFLARDHTGERPLYYYATESGSPCFAFASAPKGLHPLPFIGAEINEDYAIGYLAGLTIPAGQTIFQRISRLPAGCAIRVRAGSVQTWRYWRTESLPSLRLSSENSYVEMLRECFDRAVEVRLRTTGGIGAELSGGLDSSSVAATAARLLKASGRDLVAYTAVPRPGFSSAEDSSGHFDNEGPAAAEVAAIYPNIRHVLVDSSDGNLLDAIEHNNALYDHPCYTPNNEVWTNAIMSRARDRGLTLLLNGSSGNSTFSYEGLPGLSAIFRSGHWLRLLRLGWQMRRSRSASVRSILRNAVWPSLPFPLRRLTDPHIRSFSLDLSPIHPDLARRLDLKNRVLHELYPPTPSSRPLLEYLLHYGDLSEVALASQAGWRLDYRDPTYDRRIIEFCMTIPVEEFLRGGRLRSLARRAMSDRLPASTLVRTARGRQSADWYLSMSTLRPRMLWEISLLEASPLAGRILDLPRMRRLIENWPDHGYDRMEVQCSYHLALTRGLSMGNFLRKYDPEYCAPALGAIG